MNIKQVLRQTGLIVGLVGLAGSSWAAGTVTGKIAFQGTPPPMMVIKKGADPVCAKTPPEKDQQVVVNGNGTLKNVVVRIVKGTPQTPPPATPVVLDQHDCSYHPRVLAVMTGQKVQIKNNDPVLHNVHTYQDSKTLFNRAMMAKMPTPVEQVFPVGVTKFKCDVHPWMTAWVVANDNPYFGVSGDSGTFTLANLPAGTYTLEAWHEKYGVQTKEIAVAEGQTATADFSFKAQ